MAAAHAIQAAVKTELSYRNDTAVAFSIAANKNEGNAKLLWPLLMVKLRIPSLI